MLDYFLTNYPASQLAIPACFLILINYDGKLTNQLCWPNHLQAHPSKLCQPTPHPALLASTLLCQAQSELGLPKTALPFYPVMLENFISSYALLFPN